jgi:hypothetical protein
MVTFCWERGEDVYPLRWQVSQTAKVNKVGIQILAPQDSVESRGPAEQVPCCASEGKRPVQKGNHLSGSPVSTEEIEKRVFTGSRCECRIELARRPFTGDDTAALRRTVTVRPM